MTEWTPVGISSIQTPDGEIMLRTAKRRTVSYTVRKRICDAINATGKLNVKRRRLPTAKQLAEIVRLSPP